MANDYLDRLRDRQPDGIGCKSKIGATAPNATASTRRPARLSLGTIYPLTAARPIIRAIGVIRIGKCHSAMTQRRYWSGPINKAAVPNT